MPAGPLHGDPVARPAIPGVARERQGVVRAPIIRHDVRPMALTVYNTLAGAKQAFQPLHPPKVAMYNCGPTVYSQAHIGNFRAFLFADVLRRWLEVSGYAVTQVMNITDVGHLRADDEADAGQDRMAIAARREQLDPWKIAEKYSELFFRDLKTLGVQPAHHYPRATEYIPQMIATIERLIAAGHAYEVNGNVYFEVSTFPAYGRLSGNTSDELLAGARIEVNPEKRDPRDFALWKQDPGHIMQWDSPWGRGFPGWHVECTSMSQSLLGDSLDIHTGGEDNIFPHHDCEIAQSEGATGKPFVKYWMHSRFLQVDGGKMSKSLGNLYTVDQLEGMGHAPLALRYLLIRGHYRQVLNFTFEGLEQSAAAVRRLRLFDEQLAEAAGDAVANDEAPAWVRDASAQFDAGMDDDLNVSAALDGTFTLLNEGHRAAPTGAEAAAARAALQRMDRVLGVLESQPQSVDAEVEALIEQRAAARAAKDWAAADRIRDELAAQGIELLDGKDGVKWRRAGV